MALVDPIIYGKFEYGRNPAGPGFPVANLYGAGVENQTLVLALSDSVTMSDADIIEAIKTLLDSLTMTDSIRRAVVKVFADSITMTDVLAKLSEKSFTDQLSMTDLLTFRPTKVLVDFLLLKEWISINLLKTTLWINPSANENSYDTLYGAGTYGPTLYGARLYGGRRGNTNNWGLGQKRQEAWTNVDGHKYNI